MSIQNLVEMDSLKSKWSTFKGFVDEMSGVNYLCKENGVLQYFQNFQTDLIKHVALSPRGDKTGSGTEQPVTDSTAVKNLNQE